MLAEHTQQQTTLRNYTRTKIEIRDDKKPEMRWIDKRDIGIDRVYQRDASSKEKIAKIAANWRWSMCGSLLVARREDGSYWVYDGQHRKLAADERDDIDLLPCLVFPMGDIAAEADAFLGVNTLRKPLATAAKFRALCVKRDPVALTVEALLVQTGRKASGTAGPNTVRCLGRCLDWAETAPDKFRRLWPLIDRVCAGQVFHERIVDGMMYIEHHLPDGETLTSNRWAGRLETIGFDGLMAATGRASAFYSKGGARIWAIGILQAINKNLRNKLVIEGLPADAT